MKRCQFLITCIYLSGDELFSGCHWLVRDRNRPISDIEIDMIVHIWDSDVSLATKILPTVRDCSTHLTQMTTKIPTFLTTKASDEANRRVPTTRNMYIWQAAIKARLTGHTNS